MYTACNKDDKTDKIMATLQASKNTHTNESAASYKQGNSVSSAVYILQLSDILVL